MLRRPNGLFTAFCGVALQQVMKELAERWRALSAERRAPYDAAVAAERHAAAGEADANLE